MPESIRGSCLCGGVRYDVEGAPETMVNCHCSRCRKFTGAAHETILLLQPGQFRVLQGEDMVKTYKSEGFADRMFCSACGSSLYCKGQDKVLLEAGTLDGDPGVRPQVHIQVAYKAPWHEIADDLPQFPELPPTE